MVDYTDAKTVSLCDEWAHRRLRLGSRLVGGGCLDDAEWSQVEPARRLVLLRSELSFRSFQGPSLTVRYGAPQVAR